MIAAIINIKQQVAYGIAFNCHAARSKCKTFFCQNAKLAAQILPINVLYANILFVIKSDGIKRK
ncbi:hypothetical protein CTM70_14205 [Photobacterium phosphoreum]|nr:hypothetical protein CTM70_14205 [Photobacterium phosphoreum]